MHFLNYFEKVKIDTRGRTEQPTTHNADKCSVKDQRTRLRFIKYDDFIMAFCRPKRSLYFQRKAKDLALFITILNFCLRKDDS